MQIINTKRCDNIVNVNRYMHPKSNNAFYIKNYAHFIFTHSVRCCCFLFFKLILNNVPVPAIIIKIGYYPVSMSVLLFLSSTV